MCPHLITPNLFHTSTHNQCLMHQTRQLSHTNLSSYTTNKSYSFLGLPNGPLSGVGQDPPLTYIGIGRDNGYHFIHIAVNFRSKKSILLRQNLLEVPLYKCMYILKQSFCILRAYRIIWISGACDNIRRFPSNKTWRLYEEVMMLDLWMLW